MDIEIQYLRFTSGDYNDTGSGMAYSRSRSNSAANCEGACNPNGTFLRIYSDPDDAVVEFCDGDADVAQSYRIYGESALVEFVTGDYGGGDGSGFLLSFRGSPRTSPSLGKNIKNDLHYSTLPPCMCITS